ncbi:alpha/beta hydrolase [Paraliobacillus zengyii]|uniref:alpha/beta hydrolase n=1 Tax=Paraliobacillus zengyii TaxID=2213194 RepID=UPI000DD3CFDC|nr:alpha/beta hydrolase [Paraliobacillus zengyii]
MRPLIDTSKYENTILNISYGDVSETLKLDIFYPEAGDGPFPVIISIHGGAFKKGDKHNGEMIEPMLHGLAKGYAVVAINYRLSGEAKFPIPVKDIKRAIRFIKANRYQYNLDTKRMVVWGGSAGAYMALMAGLFEDAELFDDENDPNLDVKANVQGVVAWFPPVNFSNMDKQLEESGLLRNYPDHDAEDSPESLFLGKPLTAAGSLLDRSNPETYIHPDMPPMFIQHGRADKIVPYQQSRDFVEKVKQAGFEEKIHYEIIEDADHGDEKFETSENLDKVYAFINRLLKG